MGPDGTRWVSGQAVDRSGLAAYVHLVRAPDDPKRPPRPTAAERDAGRDQNREWRAIAKLPVPELAERIAADLADGEPRTFNRIAVEMFGKTADVLFDKAPDHALWTLVADGRVEHTVEAPIRFRLRGSR